jgi:hypothetical protein
MGTARRHRIWTDLRGRHGNYLCRFQRSAVRHCRSGHIAGPDLKPVAAFATMAAGMAADSRAVGMPRKLPSP